MDFTYDGQYGYHPLVISLAHTAAEPLFLLNRSGNRPSQERAGGEYLNKAVSLYVRAGFRKILLRGDTRIAENGIWILGIISSCCGTARRSPRPRTWIPGTKRGTSASSSAMPGLRRAQGQSQRTAGPRVSSPEPTTAVRGQDGPAPKTRAGQTGDRPPHRSENIELLEEMVAEFNSGPKTASPKRYRMVVLPQASGSEQGTDAIVLEISLLLLHSQRREMTAKR